MFKANKDLKKLLDSGDLTIGSWITIPDTSVSEIMAKLGFDWLVVDMEHSAITLSEAKNIMQVIELSGIVPLVRLGENNPNFIKRVMDAGAYGVIAPMVNSQDDAKRVVEAVKYPPEGSRGVGLARAQGYGLDFQRYKEWVNKNSIVVVQIEHIDAINNLDKILAVEGVDASIIGPYDLSASLGHPGEFRFPQLNNAIKKYEKICLELNKPMGIHSVPPNYEDILKYIDKGYRFIAFSFDALFLGTKCKDEMNNLMAKIGGRKGA